MLFRSNDQIILVKSDSTYQGLNDLAGKIVGVQDVYKRQALQKAVSMNRIVCSINNPTVITETNAYEQIYLALIL